MPKSINIFIRSEADIKGIRKAQESLSGVTESASRLNRVFSNVGLGIALDLGYRINAAFARVPDILRQATEKGLEFNRTIEDSRIGIAALFQTFQPGRFKNFNEAISLSSTVIEDLRAKAFQTSGSFRDLVGALQTIAGPALAAGLSVSQLTDLTVLLSQAVAGFGLTGNQIIQESRALITGNIGPDSLIATALGITKKDIDQAKETGTLFDFLTSKLNAFAQAGERVQESFSGLSSNLGDRIDAALGQITEVLFEETFKPALEAANEELDKLFEKERFRQIGQELASFVAVFQKAIQEGRLIETIKIAIGAGVEEGVDLSKDLISRGVGTALDEVFKDRTIILSANLGKNFAEVLLKTASLAVNLVNALVDQLVVKINNALILLGEKFLPILNKIPGVQIENNSLKIEKTFGESFLEAQQQSQQAIKGIIGFIEDHVQLTKEVLDQEQSQSDTLKNQISHREKLAELIQEEREKISARNLEEEKNRAASNFQTGEQPKQPEQPDEKSFRGGVIQYLEKGLIDVQNQAIIAGRVMDSTIGVAVDGLSAGISGLVTGARNWGQVWLQTADIIVHSLIRITTQLLVQKALGLLIPSFSTLPLLGRAEGGIIPGSPSSRDNRIAAVATGEYVTRSAAVSYYGAGLFEALNNFKVPKVALSDFKVPVRNHSSLSFAQGGLVQKPVFNNTSTPSQTVVAPADVHFGVLRSMEDVKEFMASRSGRKFIVDVVKGAKHEIGIPG